MIDVKELKYLVEEINDDALTLGGGFESVNDILDYFFSEIKKCKAKMVFIARMSRVENIDRVKPFFEIYDIIDRKGCLKKKVPRQMSSTYYDTNEMDLRPIERLWYNLLKICSKYGEVTANVGLSKRSVLAYTREYRDDVMAIIVRDTKFLVHEIDCQFWSLSHIEFNTLKIVRFDRQKLYEVYDLNHQQMQLILAIFQKKSYGILENCKRFPDKVKFIKQQNIGPNGYELAGQFTADQLQTIEHRLFVLSEKESFAYEWKDEIYSDVLAELLKDDADFNTVLQFLKDNLHIAYKLVSGLRSGPLDLLFIDVRRSDSQRFIDLVIPITLKLIGIAFKDVNPEKRPKTRQMQIKRDFNQEAELTEMDVIYPTSESM